MWTRLRLGFAALVRCTRFESDLADQLAFHVGARAEEWERRGLSPPAARRRALIELGNAERIKEEGTYVRDHQVLLGDEEHQPGSMPAERGAFNMFRRPRKPRPHLEVRTGEVLAVLGSEDAVRSSPRVRPRPGRGRGAPAPRRDAGGSRNPNAHGL